MFIDEVFKKYPNLDKPEAIFKVQNIADYTYSCYKLYFNLRDCLSYRLPFRTTWFEYEIPRYANLTTAPEHVQKYMNIFPDAIEAWQLAKIKNYEMKLRGSCGILAHYEEMSELDRLQAVYFFDLLPPYSTGGVTTYGQISFMCDKKGVLLEKYPIEGMLAEANLEQYHPMTRKDIERLRATGNAIEIISLGTMDIFLMTLNFLHCRNITHVENAYSLNRAAKRRGEKTYFEKYYTLEIGQMKKILDEQGQAQTKGLKYALHICRGHFKTYDEKGLFGKYKGTFWWPSMVKGSPEVGKINKDYSIGEVNDSGRKENGDCK